MRSTLLLLGLFIATGSFAQDNSRAIQQWQSAHPSVILISSKHYDALSAGERKLLGSDVIVFQEKITLDQLVQYSTEKSGGALAESSHTKDEDLSFVKNWLGLHQEVQVVKQSVYTQMSPARQELCTGPGFLILEGETVTRKDIEQYGY